MSAMLGRVGTVLEMIKVVVVEFQSALRVLRDFRCIENMGLGLLRAAART